MLDMFQVRHYLAKPPTDIVAQQALLRALNSAIFLGNQLYRSDFNEELFSG